MKEQQDQDQHTMIAYNLVDDFSTKIVSKHCFFQGRNYFESTTNIGRAKNFCDIVILTPNQLKSEIPRVMKSIALMNGPIFPEIIYKKYHFAAFFEDFFESCPLPARFVSMEYSLSRVWSVSSKHTTTACDIKISSKN